MPKLPLLVALGASLVVAGCEDDHPHVYAGGAGPGVTVTTDAGAATPATNTILVDVDPNQTFAPVTGGSGVGIFVEYKTGGHWHVFWSCDTSKTNQNCVFDLTCTVDRGALSNVQATSDSDADAAVDVATPAAETFVAKSTTTTSVDHLHFDAPLGAVLTLEATIGGLQTGQFFFFIQNGVVNGGFKGQLSDPLKLEASQP